MEFPLASHRGLKGLGPVGSMGSLVGIGGWVVGVGSIYERYKGVGLIYDRPQGVGRSIGSQ